MDTKTDSLASAREQGQAQFDSIREMVENLQKADEFDSPDNCEAYEDARERIQEDALSVEVRSGWELPSAFQATDDKHGFPTLKPAEYAILLCTGGPACRIVGELDEACEPVSARMEVQDWFTPWTEIRPKVAGFPDAAGETLTGKETLLAYARCFWFGE